MEILRELYKKYREEITYIFFGGMTTLVNWVTYALMNLIFGGENKILSESIAWALAVIFAFVTNKFFVFEHKSTKNILREFLSFIGARAISGFVEIGGFALLVSVLHFNDWLVKFGISVLIVIANYLLSKFLIFKK